MSNDSADRPYSTPAYPLPQSPLPPTQPMPAQSPAPWYAAGPAAPGYTHGYPVPGQPVAPPKTGTFSRAFTGTFGVLLALAVVFCILPSIVCMIFAVIGAFSTPSQPHN